MSRNLKQETTARGFIRSVLRASRVSVFVLLSFCLSVAARAQSDGGGTDAAETPQQKITRLTASVAAAHAQMQAYQQQLVEMQRQLGELQRQMSAAGGGPANGSPVTASATGDLQRSNPMTEASDATSLDELRERQGIVESQIATHELTKVETDSKYPLTVSGLVLFNGFVNTGRVDVTAAPTYALNGAGSTGLSLRQTVLGLDARGPHLFGATSHADVRVDFFANGSDPSYAAGGVLRLRTAHAGLQWKNTNVFVELDRPLVSPNEPTSLVAVALPELAWAGYLWTWNPQIGVSHQFVFSERSRLQLEAALIDVADPRIPGSSANTSSVTSTERSRWPGTEARIAFATGEHGIGMEVGAGGYFSPHRTPDGVGFNSWAGTLDLRLPLPKRFELTASAYRGQGLGGLGAGGFVDYFYRYVGSREIARALDDVGGWAQLKSKPGERLEFNTGYGIDNPFAKEINSRVPPPDGPAYTGLTRNRAYFGNVIYSPRKYLLFSLEYKRLWTNFANGAADKSDVIGLGAGYKF